MNVLFLDDDLTRCKRFRSGCPSATIVNTAAECIEQIDAESWDFIFLDHDLGHEIFVNSSRDDCGMAVVRHLERADISDKPQIVLHSLNYGAANLMFLALTRAGYVVHRVPFHMADIQQFLDDYVSQE